ncbi:hypothetical protein SAMN05444422_103218 [Halobiforma haloterrestris]|uniref:RecA-superfamily ATPase, KaiC/GvpD/RAD55 family n=1 Tax=Natronobacterium haloterrestre TaxID=148448 RepID=A0A1I1F786_NATHA|nr:hypothetical protein [Halobiforma haloterrestris]SFB95369.1 hypothetical protein SAMN05444422_103218 [Halobiforma haloterrestris]
MVTEYGSGGTDLGTFARTLERLKREGCNVLLVGANATDCHGVVCRRLCGAAGPEPRRRLFVTDGEGPVAEDAAMERGAASGNEVAVRDADHVGETIRIDEHDSLGAIGIDIVEAIDDLEDEVGGFAPSELRLCMDSVAGLFREHDAERVFRLLHVTASRVDHIDGMGHYHLPLERDHDAVNLLEPLFDAVVELRVRSDGDRREQRWHLREGETTDWISL